ncbi:MAG: hypothetical protein ACRDY7_16770 [Acidimicrobiia bacterium]
MGNHDYRTSGAKPYYGYFGDKDRGAGRQGLLQLHAGFVEDHRPQLELRCHRGLRRGLATADLAAPAGTNTSFPADRAQPIVLPRPDFVTVEHEQQLVRANLVAWDGPAHHRRARSLDMSKCSTRPSDAQALL